MGQTERIRSRSARVLAAAMVGAAVLALGSAAADGIDALLLYAAPAVLFGLLGWAVFWEPYVEVSDGGVTLANTLRTVEVPWPAINGVDGRYGLRLDTAYGPLTGWAAPSPTGRRRARGEPGIAAQAVTDRLESLQAAGHLEGRRLEHDAPRTTWHVPLLVAIAALGIAALVLPFLA